MEIKLENILRTKKPNTRKVENSEEKRKNPNLMQKREVTPLALFFDISSTFFLFLPSLFLYERRTLFIFF